MSKETRLPVPEKNASKREIENFLLANGFGGLEDKNLIHQLAFMIQDHQHFGEILRGCAPAERNNCYEAMRPHLHFEPWPLDRYLIVIM
jgi:hypothetical protein